MMAMYSSLSKHAQASLDCYLNLPDNDNPEQNPLSCHHIKEQQQANAKLLAVKQSFHKTISTYD
eukprot:15331538-Ditylum_brightwellii.AAC.2